MIVHYAVRNLPDVPQHKTLMFYVVTQVFLCMGTSLCCGTIRGGNIKHRSDA